ncbi:hypothetical protein BpHYR1_042076 [Brachionus plicatilis]|uniref:Uncharacterized protein n=1 Tax=Brachionus plicatilis TaxID=10195 RepID=A0A3M7RRL6_BRAPC|nr:hypothetical protein BpHYR1_042076 [Brachionus plicatilis]
MKSQSFKNSSLKKPEIVLKSAFTIQYGKQLTIQSLFLIDKKKINRPSFSLYSKDIFIQI